MTSMIRWTQNCPTFPLGGLVGTDNDVMIGGFIAAGGTGSAEVVIRAMESGVPGNTV
jgi:hypothetical protein